MEIKNDDNKTENNMNNNNDNDNDNKDEKNNQGVETNNIDNKNIIENIEIKDNNNNIIEHINTEGNKDDKIPAINQEGEIKEQLEDNKDQKSENIQSNNIYIEIQHKNANNNIREIELVSENDNNNNIIKEIVVKNKVNKTRKMNSENIKPVILRKSISIKRIKERSQEKLHNKELKLDKSPPRKITKIEIKNKNKIRLINSTNQLPLFEEKKKKIYKTIEQKDAKLGKFQSKKNMGKTGGNKMVIKSRKNLTESSLNDKNDKTKSYQKKISKRISQPNSTTPNQNNKSLKSRKVIMHIKGKKSDKSLYYNTSNLIKSNFKDKMNDTNKEVQRDIANINNNEKNNINQKNKKNEKNNITNYKIKKIKESDSKNKNGKKEENELNKAHTVKEINEEEDSEYGKELNELNEEDKIHYYEPQSIVNYSSANFTNKRNRKHFSFSVWKEKKILHSPFNSLIIDISKNLFKFEDNNGYNTQLQSQAFERSNNILEIKNLNDKINQKKNDIQKVNKAISNKQKELIFYNKEIRIIDNMIQKEEEERAFLQTMINYFINK